MNKRTNEVERQASAAEGSRRAAENREPMPTKAHRLVPTRTKAQALPTIARSQLPRRKYICTDHAHEDIRG